MGAKTDKRSSAAEAPRIDFSRGFNQLCHVVSLSQTDKPREALDSMVVTASALAGDQFLSLADVDEALQSFFGLTINRRELQAALDRVLSVGRLVRSRGGASVSVPGRVTVEVQRRADEGRRLEEIVRAEWVSQLGEVPALVTPDDLWSCLRDYMARVFRQHGALSVELLTSTPIDGYGDNTSLDSALEAAIDSTNCVEKPFVKNAIQAFFSSSTPSRTQYVAQLLDGTFTFFAVSMNEVAAQYVGTTLPPLTLFLDTNFVFGLLGLNDDPHGDAATELLSFIRENAFPFKLYIHQATLDEIERTVNGIGRRLLDRQWSQELSRAAISKRRVLGSLTGVEFKYHELNAVQPIDPKVFLGKYRHVELLLADFEIKVFREPFNTLFAPEEQRGELIAEYAAFVEERRPNEPKPYEALDHDITVWLAVRSRRVPGQRSPLAGGVLFVTLDRIFKAFDRRYLRKHTGGIGSIALPSQLLQVLRPYAKSTDDFDEHFVELFGVSEFRTAHSGYEEVVPRVLSLLATFADVSEETATRILADEILLQDLLDVESEQAFRDVVDNAISADNARLLEEQKEAARLQHDADTRFAAALATRDQRIGELQRALDEVQRMTEHPEVALQVVAETRSAHKVYADSDRRVAVAELHARIAAAAVVVVCAGVLIGILPWATHWVWLENHSHRLALYLDAIATSIALFVGVLVPSKWKVAIGAAGALALVALGLV